MRNRYFVTLMIVLLVGTYALTLVVSTRHLASLYSNYDPTFPLVALGLAVALELSAFLLSLTSTALSGIVTPWASNGATFTLLLVWLGNAYRMYTADPSQPWWITVLLSCFVPVGTLVIGKVIGSLFKTRERLVADERKAEQEGVFGPEREGMAAQVRQLEAALQQSQAALQQSQQAEAQQRQIARQHQQLASELQLQLSHLHSTATYRTHPFSMHEASAPTAPISRMAVPVERVVEIVANDTLAGQCVPVSIELQPDEVVAALLEDVSPPMSIETSIVILELSERADSSDNILLFADDGRKPKPPGMSSMGKRQRELYSHIKKEGPKSITDLQNHLECTPKSLDLALSKLLEQHSIIEEDGFYNIPPR